MIVPNHTARALATYQKETAAVLFDNTAFLYCLEPDPGVEESWLICFRNFLVECFNDNAVLEVATKCFETGADQLVTMNPLRKWTKKEAVARHKEMRVPHNLNVTRRKGTPPDDPEPDVTVEVR